MNTLLVGFDSAWSAKNSGAVVGVLRAGSGSLEELGTPEVVTYVAAENRIREWQDTHQPVATIVLLDQPTIVKNKLGQRPVENLVASPIGRRYGGIQPANTSRKDLFGKDAPIWQFLDRCGGPADPLEPVVGTRVFETYPALAMISLGWTLQDKRRTGRLPKYNPKRKKTFSVLDWRYVCERTLSEFVTRRLHELVGWLNDVSQRSTPRKSDQDCVDACLCLLVALFMAAQRECLMIGNMDTGYIVVPSGEALHAELRVRCEKTGRSSAGWVRPFRLSLSSQARVGAPSDKSMQQTAVGAAAEVDGYSGPI